MILAGCFSGQDDAWKVIGRQNLPESTTIYKCNAQEADMRIWRHAKATSYHKILVYSPDTDVYNIGLIMVQPPLQVVVQINLLQNQQRYIDMNKLITCLHRDPDLASLSPSKIESIILQLYIVSGCDYFAGMEKLHFKSIFLKTLHSLQVAT